MHRLTNQPKLALKGCFLEWRLFLPFYHTELCNITHNRRHLNSWWFKSWPRILTCTRKCSDSIKWRQQEVPRVREESPQVKSLGSCWGVSKCTPQNPPVQAAHRTPRQTTHTYRRVQKLSWLERPEHETGSVCLWRNFSLQLRPILMQEIFLLTKILFIAQARHYQNQ